MHAAANKQKALQSGIEIARELMEKIDRHVAGFALSATFRNVKIPLSVLDKIDISDI
jgi:hypothetical protein